MDLNTALEYHLQYNHYPPVSMLFIPACAKAIELMELEQPEEKVPPPKGIEWAPGHDTASSIVEDFHLDSFVGYEFSEAMKQ